MRPHLPHDSELSVYASSTTGLEHDTELDNFTDKLAITVLEAHVLMDAEIKSSYALIRRQSLSVVGPEMWVTKPL